MKTVVEVQDAYKSYGLSQIIKHCSFTISDGEIYGLLGINGAGKTTLMKMILGLQKIDGGNIFVLGKAIRCDWGNAPYGRPHRYSLRRVYQAGVCRKRESGGIWRKF